MDSATDQHPPTSPYLFSSASAPKNKRPRACGTCARAKSRCIPGPTPDICERCFRLRKPCSSQTPAPPRKRKEARSNRVADLERRLEELKTRLQPVVEAQQQQRHHGSQQPSPPVSQPSPPTDIRQLPTKLVEQVDPMCHIFPSMAGPPPSIACDQPAGGSPAPSGRSAASLDALRPGTSAPNSLQSTDWPDQQQSIPMIEQYRTELAHLFPFVIIPPDLNPTDRPFLWKAVIMASNYHDWPRQLHFGARLLSDIAVTAFVEPQKTIDLLQGVQLLLSWYNFNINSFQITNLLFLARSICVSLGIGEPPLSMPQGKADALTLQDLEEMRAFAGTYYLVTISFTTNKKPDELMNTSYLKSCCQALESRMEYPSDQLLVYLVRIQQLSQSISLSLALRTSSDSHQTIEYNIPPLEAVVRNFRRQLDTFEQTLPPDVKAHQTLMCHFRIAQILLFEVGLADRFACELTPAFRTELLWSCLIACRDYMDLRFEHQLLPVPASDAGGSGEDAPQYPEDCRPRTTCLASTDFIYTFMTTIKLLTLQAAATGWDLTAARAELDLESVIDRQTTQIENIMAFRRRGASGDLSLAVSHHCCKHHPLFVSWTKSRSLPPQPKEDPFEMLHCRIKSLKEILQREAPGIFPRACASAPAVDELGGGCGGEDVAAGLGDAVMQDAIVADMDMESWAYLFGTDDGWDATVPAWNPLLGGQFM